MNNSKPPLLGFSAYSGTGKTTLLEKVLPLLCQHGIRVAVIKHAHHDFDIDYPGKDSYRVRKAGAVKTLIASKHRWALIHEENTPTSDEPNLFELLSHLQTDELDLILVEGFKHERIPRIALHRKALGQKRFDSNDPEIIAVATDDTHIDFGNITVLDINQPNEITHYILRFLNENTPQLSQ